jgi:hypothetical protein
VKRSILARTLAAVLSRGGIAAARQATMPVLQGQQ